MTLIDDARRLAQGLHALALAHWKRPRRGAARGGVLIIVFSRERALQWDLLLETYTALVEDPPAITVLYSASTDAHRATYREVFGRHEGVLASTLLEQDFRRDLMATLGRCTAENLMFLVDDLVFIRPLGGCILRDWPSHGGALSLRLGHNIKSSYNAGFDALPKPTTLRPIRMMGEDRIKWRWGSGALDWQLALALDGHVLPKTLVQRLIEVSQFRAPNSLEAALGRFKFLFSATSGFAYASSRLVNLPLNSVKTEDYHFPTVGGMPTHCSTTCAWA